MKNADGVTDLFNYNFFGKFIEEHYICITLLKKEYDSFVDKESNIFQDSKYNPMTKRNYQNTNNLFNALNESEIDFLRYLGEQIEPLTSKNIQDKLLDKKFKYNTILKSIIENISVKFSVKKPLEKNLKWYGDTILKLIRVLNDSDEDFSEENTFYKFVIQNYLDSKLPDNNENENISIEDYFNILVSVHYSQNRYNNKNFDSLVDDLIHTMNDNKDVWYMRYTDILKDKYGYKMSCNIAFLDEYLCSDWKLLYLNWDLNRKRFNEKSEKNEPTYYLFDKNKVVIKPIYSLENLQNSLMEEGPSKNNSLFFRGHSNSNFHLQPSIIRNINHFANENNIYEESLVRNPEEYSNSNLTHLDILKKMQHYNIPTRLMDITDNLLVGLFFAVESNQNADGELIVLNKKISDIKYTRSDSVSILCSLPPFSQEEKNSILNIAANLKNSNLKDEEKIKKLNEKSIIKRLKHEINREKTFEPEIDPETFYKDLFVIPKRDNRRIIQQSGSFIICTLNINSHGAINKDRLEDSNSLKQIFIIPATMKKNLINTLTLFGINNSTIYPEMEKVADFLKEKYK